ncbi:Hypothetical protein, putative [Bodo saltans]|uniref:Uncharacterized protein n=1 Tax=Bodo saltans TaxID=75058 RepID=A0A0S4IHI4_BODSA|nr:Hypothetical protein, putative [Bodo saltans]|eukprot:CUE65070.1 Hypothetical protein, putative [Bodo saltans]
MAQTEYLGTLRVAEGPQVRQGLVVLNHKDAERFGIDGSTPILIRGLRRTVADVELDGTLPAGTISMNDVTCRNARAKVGLDVGLFAADSKELTKLVFTPLLRSTDRAENLERDFLTPALTGENRGLRCAKGLSYLNPKDGERFGIDGSTPILIRGLRRTVADVELEGTLPAGTISMSDVSCRNARAKVGLDVGLFRADSKELTKVVFTPLLRSTDPPENLERDYLIPALTGENAYRSLHEGDKFIVHRDNGSSVSFLVAQLTLSVIS